MVSTLTHLARPLADGAPTAGHVAFFSFISEFKNPKDFPKALFLLQAADISMYIVVAVVVYRYAGNGVSSPALGSASPLISKVAYGIAIPTVCPPTSFERGLSDSGRRSSLRVSYMAMSPPNISMYASSAAPSIWARGRGWRSGHGQRLRSPYGLLRGSSLKGTSFLSNNEGTILKPCFSIPDFNDLLALISSLFAAWFTYGISGIFWLFINKGRYTKTPLKIFLTCVNVGMFLLGLAICGMGLYASGYSIHKSNSKDSWSCVSSSSS